ncbi:MAG: ASKHA domain-containing protein [Alphaproteobacteria bacterium]|uniref:ASKHA domain-containing protein n=1 Tax=Candidatus Nitrobium versatile TaxID=2884831 RepID=A0A953J793_9BACT|nr:ASKHA domain-containing protein [Candidatus Nitrobium versatile]
MPDFFLNPLAATCSVRLEKPSPSDKRADKERLIEALSRCPGEDLPVDIPLDILRELPHTLRERDFCLSPALVFTGDRGTVAALQKTSLYGVALDIGSTNMAASLFELTTGKKVGGQEKENPQTAVGLDVLTRMHAAMGGASEKLHRLLAGGINELLLDLCREHSIVPSDIYVLTVAGNTIMTHFFLDLPVESIPLEPYIPVAHHIGFLSPREAGIAICPHGTVYVFPSVGSYVGGDIIAGILSSGLYREEAPSLLVDVGTNAEIVLGTREWLMVGAGAAGPALESGISEMGMRAVEGAVYSVEIDRESLAVRVRTLGGGTPKGICGSGMIELVAELFDAGMIDGQGRFTSRAEEAGVVKETGGSKAFIIPVPGGNNLRIKATDINNFLLSKAAMFTFLQVMVQSVGLEFVDVEKFYVSGAFGTGIDAGKAARIGMIPDKDRNAFVLMGNSSLKGAEMLLLDRSLLADIESICRMITYKEMNTDGDFMRLLPGALFIPHTDPAVLKG